MPSIECRCLIVERMGDDPAGTDDLCSCNAPSHGVGDEVGTQALALMLLIDGKAAKKAIRAKGAHLIFLPPYSPDLNPIEQVFAKLKHMMRDTQRRTVEATW